VVISGDFNRDGKQDLAVATSGGQLLILLGNGDGTFATPVSYTLSAAATQLLAADVNGDSYPDVIALLSNGTFAVLFNSGNGSGGFASPVYYNCNGVDNLAVGDFFRNGRVHIAASRSYSGGVFIYENLGNGQFLERSTVGLGGTWWVAAADLNADGYTDLVTVYNATDNILLNNGAGTFAPPVPGNLNVNFNFVAVADVDGNGTPDLILTNDNLGGGITSWVNVLLNQGSATFGTPISSQVQPTGLIGNPVVADLDGDGRPDLVAPNASGLALLRNVGGGAFEQEDILLVAGPNGPSIATIDLKGDGHLSIVTPNPASGSNALLLFTNTTPQVCGYAVTPSTAQFPSAGGTGKLNMTAASSCT
jgi:hypothetical protein